MLGRYGPFGPFFFPASVESKKQSCAIRRCCVPPPLRLRAVSRTAGEPPSGISNQFPPLTLTSDMEKASPATGPMRKRKDRDAAAPAAGPPDPAAGGNRLLAGLLAHEFLSSGTVLGERRGPGHGPCPEAGGASRYEAVAVLVQRGMARVPGVVNPTQLAAWAGR